MEKNILAVIAVIAVVAVVGGAAFVVMNNGGDNGGNDNANDSGNGSGENDGGSEGGEGGSITTSYTINPSYSNCEITGLQSNAYEGDTVSFDVVPDVENATIVINVKTQSGDVSYSGTGPYSFTMPAANVTVTVEAYSAILSDRFLKWDDTNPASIEKWQEQYEGDTYWSGDDITFTISVSNTTMIDGQARINYDVLDTNVIAEDAIKPETHDRNDNGFVDGISLTLDRSKINGGETMLLIEVTNTNVSPQSTAKLVVPLTVIVPEPLNPVTFYNTSVTVDLSGIAENLRKNYYVELVDQDWNNDYAMREQDVYARDYDIGADGTFNFDVKLTADHDYKFSISEYRNNTTVSVSYSDVTNATVTHIDGTIRFTADNGSVTITPNRY